MKLVTISDFQGATGLSNDSVMWLIKNNKIHMEFNKARGLMVDAEIISKNDLIEALAQTELTAIENQRDLIKERLALIIENKLSELLDIALSKA